MVWLPIVNSNYFISNLGRIKNKNDKISKGGIRKADGYVRMKLYINGIYKVVYAHRLVAQAFIPNSENTLYVNHINGIRHDNRADNLEWVSLKENNNRRT